jgi:hypothetical protein
MQNKDKAKGKRLAEGESDGEPGTSSQAPSLGLTELRRLLAAVDAGAEEKPRRQPFRRSPR